LPGATAPVGLATGALATKPGADEGSLRGPVVPVDLELQPVHTVLLNKKPAGSAHHGCADALPAFGGVDYDLSELRDPRAAVDERPLQRAQLVRAADRDQPPGVLAVGVELGAQLGFALIADSEVLRAGGMRAHRGEPGRVVAVRGAQRQLLQGQGHRPTFN
jgi:hypothetical protein